MSDVAAHPQSRREAGAIGERIKQARKSLSMNQSDLARRLGVSQPAVANWEAGVHDPRPLMLVKIAEALDVPLAWLAEGQRSGVETDKQPAAAYLRRPLKHVPVISLSAAARLLHDPEVDPHAYAEDYIPVTAGAGRLFALFMNDEAVNLAFPRDTLVVFDAADRAPAEGRFFLVEVAGRPLLRLWREAPMRLEPYSSHPAQETIYLDGAEGVVGAARVSIRFH